MPLQPPSSRNALIAAQNLSILAKLVAPPVSDLLKEKAVVSSPSIPNSLQLNIVSSAPERQLCSSENMANFPFDPTPFLPPDRIAIEVDGRPARVRVIHGELRISNEDLAILTIVPMPQGEVAFQNVQEIIGEFFAEKRVPIKSVTRCPFGQAFIRFDSIEDRDWFVGNGPHPCDDVQLIFQKHNEGLNWRKFELNREVWVQIIGFPADLRCMHEIANAVKSFGKLLAWDRIKTTDAYVLIKISVAALSDIPASTVVSGTDRFSGESWSCPIVILQDNLIGNGPPFEDEVPADGLPHPMPPEQFHHPNQNNHFIGPIAMHEDLEAENVEIPQVGNQVNNNPIHMDNENQIMDNAVGWDQWALAPAGGMIDMELHAGEFLELNDLMGPAEVLPGAMEDEENDGGSDLTLTINLPINDDSNNSIQGPAMHQGNQIAHPPFQFPDLNLPANGEMREVLAPQNNAHIPALDIFPFPDMEDPLGQQAVNDDVLQDPAQDTLMSALVLSTEIQCNLALSQNDSAVIKVDQITDVATVAKGIHTGDDISIIGHMTELTETEISTPITSQDNIAVKSLLLTQPDQQAIAINDKTDYMEMEQNTALENDHISGNSSSGAPPGFPVPLYKDVTSQNKDKAIAQEEENMDYVSQIMMEKCLFTDAGLIGEEGANLWKKYFAPQSDQEAVIQMY
ncbi:unnamed protein product [Alopecurus aequalis]